MPDEPKKAVLQFPLACLSYPGDWLAYAIEWAITNYAVTQCNDDAQEAGRRLDISFSSDLGLRQCHQVMQHHIERQPWNAARCMVRIDKALCFEVRDGEGMREADFRILCALKSVIGNKPMMRVCREWLGPRALGFINAKDLSSSQRKQIPSLAKIRASLERVSGFFAKVRANPRQTYYSDKLMPEALAEAVFQLKTRQVARRAERSQNDLSLWRRIREANRSQPKSGATTQPHDNHYDAATPPRDNHHDATVSATAATTRTATNTTTIIKTLNRNLQ